LDLDLNGDGCEEGPSIDEEEGGDEEIRGEEERRRKLKLGLFGRLGDEERGGVGGCANGGPVDEDQDRRLNR
jgi:hypothetical protein